MRIAFPLTKPCLPELRIFILGVLVWTVCSSARGADEVEPILDIPYGSDELQRLDIYLPKTVAGTPRAPGRPLDSRRRLDRRRQTARAQRHLGPEQRAGGAGVRGVFLQLPAAAQGHSPRPSRRRAAGGSLDPRKCRQVSCRSRPDRHVGISAGGHLACMLAVRETRARQNDPLDKYSSKVQVAVSLNGPTDLRHRPSRRRP